MGAMSVHAYNAPATAAAPNFTHTEPHPHVQRVALDVV